MSQLIRTITEDGAAAAGAAVGAATGAAVEGATAAPTGAAATGVALTAATPVVLTWTGSVVIMVMVLPPLVIVIDLLLQGFLTPSLLTLELDRLLPVPSCEESLRFMLTGMVMFAGMVEFAAGIEALDGAAPEEVALLATAEDMTLLVAVCVTMAVAVAVWVTTFPCVPETKAAIKMGISFIALLS